MIDQRVEEKWAKFQAEYDEVLNKVKKNVSSMFKPGSLMPARTAQSEVKGKSAQEEEKVSATRPATALKRIGAGMKSMIGSASQKRSDSKESQKSNKGSLSNITADDKRKE